MKIYGGVDATVKHHRIGDPQGVEADLAGVVQQEKKRAAAEQLREQPRSSVIDHATIVIG